MKCEICHASEAESVLKQADGNELFVCAGCARASREKTAETERAGKESNREEAMQDLLSATLKLVKTISENGINGEKLLEKCPKCGLAFKSFDKSGLAGCPACYEAFAPAIDAKYLRAQFARRHVGEPPEYAAPAPGEESPAWLKSELKKAVAAEDYKRAAELKRRLDKADQSTQPERGGDD